MAINWTHYQAALDADDAWMAAIRQAFPRKRAGDVRYYPEGKGEPGTPLRAAYDAYVEAHAKAGFPRHGTV